MKEFETRLSPHALYEEDILKKADKMLAVIRKWVKDYHIPRQGFDDEDAVDMILMWERCGGV